MRYDKAWSDSMTVTDLRGLCCQTSGKLFKQAGQTSAEAVDSSQPAAKRRRVAEQQQQQPKVKYAAVDSSQVAAVTASLAGQVVVVEPGPDKADLERIALLHGATVEQNFVQGRTHKYVQVSRTIQRNNFMRLIVSLFVVDCGQTPCQVCHRFRHLRRDQVRLVVGLQPDLSTAQAFGHGGDDGGDGRRIQSPKV